MTGEHGGGRYKFMPCRVCGEPVRVGASKRKEPRCIECGIKVSAQVMKDLTNRSGQYYDKWLQGCLNTKLDQGGGSTPTIKSSSDVDRA